ncbi:F-box/FBD/LRR-repeat protein At1g16930 [Rosa chinensis]|uniref:F-box/FBD/LRR-repeat protein At1g16930 n=1 Tax=Rosa chinensis TaxID=74649 RepID=UPI000D08741B|nr:F-box/FBD/LRR-repeat protein At1g16930 [Rosa chinensis]
MRVQTGKKKRVEKMGSIDRISALPDELVRHILSCMPTLDSVRTSVLSKRWNNLWTSVPNLDFYDRRDFPADDADNDVRLRRPRCDRFARFVSSVLYSRDAIDIGKFSLSVGTPHHLPVIEDWICAVARRNVVELQLAFHVPSIFWIPRCILMCKTLRVLGLCLWDFDFAIDPPTSGCFPSLKVLHVRVSSDNLYLMGKLFSYCPVLEDLTIDGKVKNGDTDIGYNFNVSVPQVKTLNISLEVGMARSRRGHEYEQFETRINVYIDAPKLEKLDLKKDGFTNYVLMGRAKSLVNASIDVRDSRAKNPPHFPSCATALLVGISNVKYLSLLAPWSKDWRLPAFDNLKQLRLVLVDCNYWEVLPEFLHCAPNLEDLVLENVTECERQYPRCEWGLPKDVPICLLSHLKTISISGFKGQWAEREIAKYLLKNGSFLDEMLIYTDGVYAVRDFHKEFSMFHRMVKFIQM